MATVLSNYVDVKQSKFFCKYLKSIFMSGKLGLNLFKLSLFSNFFILFLSYYTEMGTKSSNDKLPVLTVCSEISVLHYS